MVSTDIDFQSYKNSLKDFLKAQSEFTDYDFEGSGLNILLDVLAVNAHHLGYYANMMANESFLDTALMKSSVVSHAKALGYTPRSATASRANINLRINSPTGSPATITVPRDTKFTSIVDGKSYTFFTNDTYIASSSNNYLINNVVLYEGSRYTYRYTVNTQNPEKYIIPNKNVDISLLSVVVQNSNVDTTQIVYNKADSFTSLDPESEVYFVSKDLSGNYEISFGDGVLGKALSNGNIVIFDYIITNGEIANDCQQFTLVNSIAGNTNITITVNSKSFGGADEESIESIRYSAPKLYQAQNRAVTRNDYISLLSSLYPDGRSFSVWGGEDNVPPIFGKVFISIQPNEGLVVTNAAKEYIKNTLLKSYTVVSIIPELIDPSYTNIVIKSNITYNSRSVSLGEEQLKTLIQNSIEQYGLDTLNQFDRSFKFSPLVRYIDSIDTYITGNNTKIELLNDITPSINVKNEYIIELTNPIVAGSVYSTAFDFLEDLSDTTVANRIHYFDDDGNGKLRIYRVVAGTKIYQNSNAGTVDYTNGKIIISPITFTSYGDKLSVGASPVSFDVASNRNQILVISKENINITMIPEN